MNNDSTILMINGQSQFEKMTIEEKEKIKNLICSLNKICTNDYNYLQEAQKNINVENVQKIMNYMDNIIKNEQIDENQKIKIKKIKYKILKITSPALRYQFKQSSFCKALENGEWILIEHIL